MEDYTLRLIDEFKKLDEKIHRLGQFIKSYESGEAFDFNLNYPIEVLKSQYHVMVSYSQILKLRGELDGIDLELESKLPTVEGMQEWEREAAIENGGGCWLDQN
ncbi:TPA: hypothetical protein VBD25_001296 [Streptococcus agalactiae]|nr:hypothetical protein [Streptococcus agalactiae]